MSLASHYNSLSLNTKYSMPAADLRMGEQWMIMEILSGRTVCVYFLKTLRLLMSLMIATSLEIQG